MVAPADERQCVCCNESMAGGSHACMTCNADLHSVVMCNKQWMPNDGDYFCSQACIQEYNGRDDVVRTVPLRSRPTSAEVEPVVAAPIAPALQPQPGAPSNVNLNPVPSARTLRPYPPPVPSARTLRPYPTPLLTARTLCSYPRHDTNEQRGCRRGSTELLLQRQQSPVRMTLLRQQ